MRDPAARLGWQVVADDWTRRRPARLGPHLTFWMRAAPHDQEVLLVSGAE